MLRKLYAWTMSYATHPHAVWVLGLISFAESSFFPIPPDALLVPMILANRNAAWRLAGWCTLTSVVGGIVGYGIGWLLYDSVGLWLINFYGYGSQMDTFRAAYAEWGAWLILIKGLTPIPFKLVTIASGFAGYNFLLFVVLSLITRGARFFIEAWLLRRYGEPVRAFIEHRLELVTTIFAVVIIGGFVLVRYVI
ncbi:YqaA family protein [Pseudoxanthobacter sp.]|uniref:YqaA family protein n=1 Tax=Pseudoxanthobacter sp. TaxID=1925742 RepID=UPI002FE0ACFB